MVFGYKFFSYYLSEAKKNETDSLFSRILGSLRRPSRRKIPFFNSSTWLWALLLSLIYSFPLSAKTLVYCSEASPENLTAALNTTNSSWDAARPVYNTLVNFEEQGMTIVPGLAERWEFGPDGKTLILHLRKNVKFGAIKGFVPTRPFNAEDVIFSFERQWKTTHPYYKISGGKYDYFHDMDMAQILHSLEKLDDYTIKMTLNEPNSAILANLAMDFLNIHSAEYAETLLQQGRPHQFDQIPVGTGPFIFIHYHKDALIRYKAHPDCWEGKPPVDELIFAITPDPAVRYAKLKAGECHIMTYPRPADLEEMKQQTHLQILSQPGLNISYWAFNTQKKPLNDKRVRQALSMAIDRAAILRDGYLGTGEPAKNLIPPTMWAHNDAIEAYPYDPARAQELLREASIALPLQINLWYMPVQRPYNPNSKRIAEMMQADLHKIGVEARLVTYEWGEYRKSLQQGDAITAQFGWTGDNGDPDNFFFLLGCTASVAGGNNVAKWCHPGFEERLQRARKLTDIAERRKLYLEMQEIAHEEAPLFYIAHAKVYAALRKEVSGFTQSPFARNQFHKVHLDLP